MPAFTLSGWAQEADPIVEKIYEDFHKEHGTNVGDRPMVPAGGSR